MTVVIKGGLVLDQTGERRADVVIDGRIVIDVVELDGGDV